MNSSEPSFVSSRELPVERESLVAPPIQTPRATSAAPPIQVPRASAAAPPRVVLQAEELQLAFEQSLAPPPAPLWRQRIGAALDYCSGRRAPWTSFAISTVVHLLLMLVLGWLMLPRDLAPRSLRIEARWGQNLQGVESIASLLTPASTAGAMNAVQVQTDNSVVIVAPHEARPSPKHNPLSPHLGFDDALSRGLTETVDANPYGDLGSREPTYRQRILGTSGGPTLQSEKAVDHGLKWLALHQLPDGSWNFDFARCPACNGLCRNSGAISSTTGATGLALLCFLGRGNTHRSGEYHEVVNKGIYYLQRRLQVTERGGDLREGTMYAQGIATLALCEARIMSGDTSLDRYAQSTLDFIMYSQDPNGGGWRYDPGQPGDTTVTGWQIMALKSGRAADLRVPSSVIYHANKFFDYVQSEQGAYYGYLASGKEPTCTAVGLMSRMLLGWRRDRPELYRGVRYLTGLGPSKGDMYFNYYTTAVLHHLGGDDWLLWNQKMRQYLIDTQSQSGHENGSWYFEDAHESGPQGGRLYNTCMALMTLEVYYRFLPLYQPQTLKLK